MSTTSQPGLTAVGPVRADVVSHAIAFAGLAALAVGAATGVVTLAQAACISLVVPAAVVDVRERRLPDGWLTLAAATFAGWSLAAWAAGGELPVAGSLAGAAGLAGPLLVAHLVSPRSMGFGDVKAAAVLGLALGASGWALALCALALAAGSAGTVGLIARRPTIPFGPFLVGAAIVVVLSPSVWLAGVAG